MAPRAKFYYSHLKTFKQVTVYSILIYFYIFLTVLRRSRLTFHLLDGVYKLAHESHKAGTFFVRVQYLGDKRLSKREKLPVQWGQLNWAPGQLRIAKNPPR